LINKTIDPNVYKFDFKNDIMDSFIKRVFDGKKDELVHLQFQKFSRGEFKEKAMVKASKVKDKVMINTTAEYANELVRSIAEKLTSGQKIKVTGVIVSTRNLKEIPEFNKLFSDVEIKQFMGIKQFKINTNMTKEEIIRICDLLPTSFIGLSFSAGDTDLKIKPKAPKSAKPSTSDKGPKIDFCKIKTSDPEIIKGILFDVGNFKKIEIKYDYIITDIIIPKEESDPAKMREKAIKKGKIIRTVIIDGIKNTKEKDFEA
jgi:hypothetical protein